MNRSWESRAKSCDISASEFETGGEIGKTGHDREEVEVIRTGWCDYCTIPLEISMLV